MKDYVAEFQRRITSIDEDAKSLRIINAGVMNHGKSSLFNSLLDAEHFAEQDIRTTMVNKEVEWIKGVYLVDTPGLNAESSDDAEAYAAYRRANMIVFCHTAKVGELREAELNAINNMKALFDNDEFFWKHFCLVITFLDSDSTDNISIIKNKSLSDLEKYCGGKDFPTFLVSNSRYRKGRDENKPQLVKLSGVPELREFLQGMTKQWWDENAYFRSLSIKREKAELLSEVERERESVKEAMKKKKAEVKNKQKYYLSQIQSLVDDIEYYQQTIEEKELVLESLEEDLYDLQAQHNREYF